MQFWFTAYNSLIQGAIVVFLWRPRRSQHTPFRWRWTIAAVGMLLLLSDALYFHALAMPGALVSVISTLRRTNVVLSFAIGSLLFGECYRLRKSFALAGVIVGVFLIL
jgi:drug/metabolite transporter (DMT)-like permease